MHIVRLVGAVLGTLVCGAYVVAFEVAIAAGWVLSIAWVLLTHLAWCLPLMPLCSPIQP